MKKRRKLAHLAPSGRKSHRTVGAHAATRESDGSVSSGEIRKRSRRGGRRGTGLHIALIAAMSILVLLGCAVFFTLNHFYSKLNVEMPEKDASGQVSVERVDASALNAETNRDYTDSDVTNILLIGVDNDYLQGMSERGNADGLILASINKNTKQIVLTSIMRDVCVSVQDSFKAKITTVYQHSGTQTLLSTIETSLKIPIDGYVLVNYLNIIDIIDAMGGLTLDLSVDEIYWMESKIKNLTLLTGAAYEDNMINTDEAGTLHLNGLQTAAYLRVRYAGNGDYERTERARRVIMLLKDKAMAMNLAQLNKLTDTVLPLITTDLSRTKLISLLVNAVNILKYETVSIRIPAEGTYEESEDGSFMLLADFEANSQYLYSAVYDGVVENSVGQ